MVSGSGLQTLGQGLPSSYFTASPLMALCGDIRWLRSSPCESAPPMRDTQDKCVPSACSAAPPTSMAQGMQAYCAA